MTEHIGSAAVSRRSFVKAGALGAASTVAVSGLFGCASNEEEATDEPTDEAPEQEAPAEPEAMEVAPVEADPDDQIVISACMVNCASHCTLKWHVRDGHVVYMETDDSGDESFQTRACLRGRSMRRWLNSPERLMYPMKRIGKRGEGKFERISWDEALATIHDKLEQVIADYGNEAVYSQYSSGRLSCMEYAGNGMFKRLLATLGGNLNFYGSYSAAQITMAAAQMFGPVDSFNGSSLNEAENSDLVVLWGNSPAETRMGGANMAWDFTRVREAVEERGGKIVNIDYRLSETASGHGDQWIPIMPGTDAALVAALIHEFIGHGTIDARVNDYCVGFDEDGMPEAFKGKNMSYTDYVMGTGYDMVEKTPEWAEQITKVPADSIRSLAADLEAAEAPFVVQGWGPQRRSNGGLTCRAIALVPVVLGKYGMPGTNTGLREVMPAPGVGNLPALPNPVATSISCFTWLDAIDHGPEMTALNAGVRGADKLSTGIKFMWNHAGNCITNQHGDINLVHQVLSDESKCEMIVVVDTVMTDSALYADILLPDCMPSETMDMVPNGDAEYHCGVTISSKAQDAPGECRTSWDIAVELAKLFGKEEEVTEGKSKEEWMQELYAAAREAHPNMPEWDNMVAQGVYKEEIPHNIALQAFRDDPQANPLSTPSGKIEIFSEDVQALADTWELEEGDVICAIPIFDPGREQYGSTTDEYPLYGAGFHTKSRTHSSFGFISELEQAARHQAWINPADAQARGIADGDVCSIRNARGEIRIEAKVTNRIVPGVVAIPQGAWHRADMEGDKIDYGGCVNTLVMNHPSPMAKGNPSHSFICEVTKA